MIRIQQNTTQAQQADSKNNNSIELKSISNKTQKNQYEHPIKSHYDSPSKICKIISAKLNHTKKSLPVKNFHYGDKKPNTQTPNKVKNQSPKSASSVQLLDQSQNLESMPIKIVKDKIQHEQNKKTKYQKTKSHRFFDYQTQKQTQNNRKNILFMSTTPNFNKITPQQNLLQSEKPLKMSIFERYNYQNYQNYHYRAPFKNQGNHVKNQESEKYRFPRNEKYSPNRGSGKNLEIIFCEINYPDFVQKSNQLFEKSSQNQIHKISKLSLLSRNHLQLQKIQSNIQKQSQNQNLLIKTIKSQSCKLINSKNLINDQNLTKWSYINSKKQKYVRSASFKNNILTYNTNKIKSTLEKLLQEFKSLQKLSELNLNQQKSNFKYKKSFQQTLEDHSKTVLVNLIVDKFPFLQNLRKSFRNHMLKTLFKLDTINENKKISIYDYLKFNRIFISRDSPIQELSQFVAKLLFKNFSQTALSTAEKILKQLNPRNKQKLENIICNLPQICEICESNETTLLQRLRENSEFLYTLIELIKDQ